MQMPSASLRLQCLIAFHHTLSAGTADCKLHGQHRHAHHQQADQIKQHKIAAAVFARDIGKTPHITDADCAARADQQKAQPRAERFALHEESLLLGKNMQLF